MRWAGLFRPTIIGSPRIPGMLDLLVLALANFVLESTPRLAGELLASGFDELRIDDRWTITVMICFQTIR
ncbi:MAG TPA: hypothetical protein VHS80_13315, partial [Chthoniobacterales bacterium]|nr:hypothetical protein [Chthoniobacterales bacterium]